MTSVLYYRYDISFIEDALFDRICKYLSTKADSIPEEFTGIIDKESLSAGTGFTVDISRKSILNSIVIELYYKHRIL